ncbi:MAG: vWA domain-containing protein [Anaerolineae bacterium]
MRFLSPWALLFAVLSVPIILLYMLKRRRRDVLVSSTLLWQQLLRDREANAPWQKLRRNLLLLLQLLGLALLTLALARPALPTETVVSGNAVLLLDVSASMQARDVAPSRFEAARAAALEIIKELGPGDAVTLIAVGPQVELLAQAERDPGRLRRALEQLAPTAGAADWESALALAGAGTAGAPDTEILLISDGALPEELPAVAGRLRLIDVGGGGRNVALTALATRHGERGPQAFLVATNYGNAEVTPLVEVRVDGQLFDARRLPIPAEDAATWTLTDLPYDARVVEARLSDPDPAENALTLDDAAWAVRGASDKRSVLLVSEGNLFLERALGALPTPALTRVAPGDPLPEGDHDLVVYDAVAPETLPQGNVWLIAPPTTVEEPRLAVSGVFSDTALTRVARDDPRLRYVDLSDVHVLRARKVTPAADAEVLIEAAGGPLLFVVERPTGRLAVLTFDLHDSDLPLRVAFPLLTAQLVDWLLPAGDGLGDVSSVRPGEPVPLRRHPEAARIVITAPTGEEQVIPEDAARPTFAATEHLGVYAVRQLDRDGAPVATSAFAVNLFDPTESEIAPKATVRVGERPLEAAEAMTEGRQELWPWFVVGALLVLSVEWGRYYGVRFAILGELVDRSNVKDVSRNPSTTLRTGTHHEAL